MSRVHLTVHRDGNYFVLQLELLPCEPTGQVRLCWPSHHFHNPGSAHLGMGPSGHTKHQGLYFGAAIRVHPSRLPPPAEPRSGSGKLWKEEGRALLQLSSRGSSIISLRPLTGRPQGPLLSPRCDTQHKASPLVVSAYLGSAGF